MVSMKWLRTHNKKIMAGLVLFAMFSFIGGSALYNLFTPRYESQVIGTLRGKSVTVGDVAPAMHDKSVLERFGIGLSAPSAKRGGQPRELSGDYWYLLAREAEEAGIDVSPGEVDAIMKSMGVTAEALNSQQGRDRITEGDIRDALTRFLKINKNRSRVMSAAAASEPEIRHYVRDTKETASVKLVALDANLFVDNTTPIAEDDLKAQFEAFKDADLKTSESGFGYKLPRRVKVQYVSAVIQRMAPMIEITLEEAKAHWRKNKESYKKSVPDPNAPAPTTATSQPEPPKMIQVEKEFSEARTQVEQQLRDRKATQLAQQAMRKIANEAMKPWLGVKADATTGYKPIPDEVKAPDFLEKIVRQVEAEMGLPAMRISLLYQQQELMSEEELGRLANIGRAYTMGEASERLGFPQYAFRVPSFFTREHASDTTLALQLYQTPDAPLQSMGSMFQFQGMSMQTDLHLFRVVEVRDSEVPADMTPVRTQVERDVRRQHGYATAEPMARTLLAAARRLGLADGLAASPDVTTKTTLSVPTSPAPFARRAAYSKDAPVVMGLNASSREFVDAVFEMADESWSLPAEQLPTTLPEAATTRPALAPAPKVRLVGLPKLGKWVVVEFIKIEGVTQDKFEKEYRREAINALGQERGQEVLSAWMDPANIDKRMNYARSDAPLRPRGVDAPPQF